MSIKLFLPVIVTLLLLMVSCVQTGIMGVSNFFPAVDIIAIYFWSSQRPNNFPYWFVFILGVLRDSLEGGLFGVSALVYLIIRFVAFSCRNLYKMESFIIMWQGFAVICLLAIAMKWALVSFFAKTPVATDAAIMQFMVTVAMYPMINWFFNQINSVMPENFNNE